MITRLLSLVLLISAGELYLVNLKSPQDPLFLFISNNNYVMLARSLLLLLIVGISFKKRFNYRQSRYLCMILGCLLITFGIGTFLSPTIADELGSYFGVFDLVLMIEMGIILSLSALSLPSAQISPSKKEAALVRSRRHVVVRFEPDIASAVRAK